MPSQSSLNFWSYLGNSSIADEIVLLYCLLPLNEISARNCYHLRVHSDEPRSEKRCLFQKKGCLCFWFKVAAHHSLIMYRQLLDALLWHFLWGDRLSFVNQNILNRWSWCSLLATSFCRSGWIVVSSGVPARPACNTPNTSIESQSIKHNYKPIKQFWNMAAIVFRWSFIKWPYWSFSKPCISWNI